MKPVNNFFQIYSADCDPTMVLPPLSEDTKMFQESTKLCRYRGNLQLYPTNIWKWITGSFIKSIFTCYELPLNNFLT